MKNKAFAEIINAIKRMKLLSILIALVVAGAVVAALLPPLILEKIVDRLSGGSDVSFLLALTYFGMLALSGLLDSAREALLSVFGQKITHALRSALCKKLDRIPADTLIKTDPGVTASRFVGDVDTVEELFTSGIISMFADACQVISIFVILFIKNPGLALVLLLLLPFIFIFTRHTQKAMLAAEKQNRVAVGLASSHVPETLRCIRTIQNLRAERHMEERYDEFLEDSFSAIERTNFFDSIYSPIILILNAAVVAIVMILSATGSAGIQSFFGMSVGTSVAVISYISQVFSPIEGIGMEIQTIQSAAAGVARIHEFLDLPERDMTLQEGPCPVESGDVCANVNHLSFGYEKDKLILKDISFSVAAGEQLTLVGRTGAGKSTLFKLLLGMYSPVSGSISVWGQSADHIPDKYKRHLFGYVEQTFYQVPGSVMDQIKLSSPEISDEDVYRAAKTIGLHRTIESFPEGYSTICRPELFSQGQWQLLSIARAIAADPKILLLDEITANLDADTELTVLSALKAASENRTVISISHRLYESMGGRIISIG